MIDNPKLHQDLMTLINSDWSDSEDARDFGSRDLIFARRTQWDDDLDFNVDTEYRGQFDIVKPERRRILSQLMRIEFSNKFRAKSDENEELADILQNHYRAITRTNSAKIAAEVAITEAIDCGFGAWRIEVVDEDESDPLNNNKKIVRSPIHEANNKVVWDANSKLIDKSDAKRCAVVTTYTNSAWKELMEEFGLSENESEFPLPDYLLSSSITWRDSQTKTLAEVYSVKEIKQKVTLFSDGVDTVALTNSEMKKQADYFRSMDYEKIAKKTVIKKEVWKTVLTGAHILERYKIAGKHIPVISLYGEWGFINGTEIREGLVRMLRDPQQMRNTTMSYVFDLLSKGPIEKDIYLQEQIDGYEEMYEGQNQYKAPYYMQNRYDSQGVELPYGPVGKRNAVNIPPVAHYLIEKSEQSVAQSVGGGITPEQMINPQITEGQLQIIQGRLDQQSQMYQEHLEYSYRREGVVVASIMAEIYDNEREIDLISSDGQESTVKINEVKTDYGSMSTVIKNDMRNAEMEVFSDVGLSFATQKENVRNEMREYMSTGALSPQSMQLAQWTYEMSLEGTEFKPMRENARKQMIISGNIDETDMTEKEKAMLAQHMQQQAQNQQQDPMMLAAQAEMEKAKAQQQEAANKTALIQLEAQKVQLEIEKFRAEMQGKLGVEGAKLEQGQQKINLQAQKQSSDTAIELAKLEMEATRDLNNEFRSNLNAVIGGI